MTNTLKRVDQIAGNKYAEGKIQLWDLRLRDWRRHYFKQHGQSPTRQEEDAFFSTIAMLTQWVDDPEFGKPVEFSPEQIEQIRRSLGGMPRLSRDFEKFLNKHVIDTQMTIEEAY